MDIDCWMHSWDDASKQYEMPLSSELGRCGVKVESFRWGTPNRPGVCLFTEKGPELRSFVQLVSRAGLERIIAIACSGASQEEPGHWELLHAGASDVLVWTDPDRVALQTQARFERWLSVERLMAEPTVIELLIAKNAQWRIILRNIVEIGRYSDATVLIQGESGTGKELAAQLIHRLDSRPHKRDFVVVDCSTLVRELSGSEFFGHERGAFTGASTDRLGAFALANGGTLFLDEVGELPLPLQMQLLRVIQEGLYKRVGGNSWHKTSFRLVCATNRDLWDLVHRGAFRADLYHRIVGCICKLPPLRERPEDILPLAEHFFSRASSGGVPPALDASVRDYLQKREYPGNVRDLQQVVSRLIYHQAPDRTISIGYIPAEERPLEWEEIYWPNLQFEHAIRRAVLFGASLREISRTAEEIAIRAAIEEEDGSLQRAARRLGVTDRALQLRRASQRQLMDAR